MRQTIKSLTLDEIEGLNGKGGRIVQVISCGLEYRRTEVDGVWSEEPKMVYQCLVEEEEETVDEIESVEYLEDGKHLIIYFKDKRKGTRIIPIKDLTKGLEEEKEDEQPNQRD